MHLHPSGSLHTWNLAPSGVLLVRQPVQARRAAAHGGWTMLILGFALGLAIGVALAALNGDLAYQKGYEDARRLEIRRALERERRDREWRHA